MIFVHLIFNNTLNKRDNLALRTNFLTWYLAKVNVKPFFPQNTRKMCLFIERNERELIIRRRNGRRTMNKNKFDYQIVTEYHFLFLLPPLMPTIIHNHMWEARFPHGLCARLRSERSGFEPWPGTLCCVLGQDTLLSRCLSPARCINGYRRT